MHQSLSRSDVVEGYVDGWDGCSLRGWAWVPSQRTAVVKIEVRDAAGTVLASRMANIYRGDLAAAGKRDGACSFFLAVPEVGGQLHAVAIAGDVETELVGSPMEHPGSAAASAPRPFDNRLADGTALEGYLDEIGPDHLRGWVHDGTVFGPAVELELVENCLCLASACANLWRSDLEHLRQGNGRVGYTIPLPAALYDGRLHRLMLRRADTQVDLLSQPIEIRLAGDAPQPEPIRAIGRPAPDSPIQLSFVVNFYNMRRQAARTLHTLSRRFQRNAEDIAYEVLCIDNGSDEPLSEAFVEGFGPEFKLFKPARIHPSPAFALNEAAATARGEFLAMMIDGAHLVTPGVIAEAMAALHSASGAVVGLRQWFIGGDQRWLSTVGYSEDHEDIVYARIGWPDCGYDVFKIGTPIIEGANQWFDPMSETNCLFLSAEHYRRIGGYDERFDEPGGGFANLDIFTRAARAPGATMIALAGEASFHQYHGGTTTNVSDADKDARVRAYASNFEHHRSEQFVNLPIDEIRVWGRMHTRDALTGRRPDTNRVRLGLTDRLRPSSLAATFGRGEQSLACTAYVEAGLHERATWRGQPTGVAPGDLIEMQQVLWSTRPDAIICKDISPGLLSYLLSLASVLDLDASRFLWVTAAEATPPRAGVSHIVGDPADDGVLGEIESWIGACESSCVFFQPRTDEPMPLDALRRFGRFVSAGNHMIVLGGAFGQPAVGYSDRFIDAAITRFIWSERNFQRDYTLNAHLVTTCPSGFLRRIPDVHCDLRYDPVLDDLEGV